MMLAAEGLSIGYGRKVIGRGIDVALDAGEVLALLGPNGGGKTTLLKTLLGLLPALAGTVTIDGRPLGALGARDRARLIAYVPQTAGTTFAFSVTDLVMMGRTAHAGLLEAPTARDRSLVATALERLGIAHLADRPCTEISGGERQLALVARALAQEPRVIVLDEPTASLDFGNQGGVMREIRRLAADGLAVLFSTHDPNHALRHADRALLIRDGGCLASGPAVEVLTADTLEALYRAPVHVAGSGVERVFLPG